MTKEKLKLLCEQASKKVDAAIAAHQGGKPADLSVPLLTKVKSELGQMSSALSSDTYRPAFGRIILEWPDEHGLVKFLLEVEYQYNRCK